MNERVESALRNAVYHRNYRRARDRARTRLIHLYPDQYQALLEEERKRDELEGKKWNSIADSPAYRRANGQGDSASTNATERDSHPSANQGDDEGEA